MEPITISGPAANFWKNAGTMELGTFDVTSTDGAIVADPTYIRDSQPPFAHEIALKPGTYKTTLLVADHQSWGRRVVAMHTELVQAGGRALPDTRTRWLERFFDIAPSDVKDEPLSPNYPIDWEHPLDEIGVDSGRMCIVDARRRPKSPTDADAFSNRAGDNRALDGGIGVIAHSGCGDGYYPVYLARHENEIVGLVVDFIPEAILERNERFAKRFLSKKSPQQSPHIAGLSRTDIDPPVGQLCERTTVLAYLTWLRGLKDELEQADFDLVKAQAFQRAGIAYTLLEDTPHQEERFARAMNHIAIALRHDMGFEEGKIQDRFGAFAAELQIHRQNMRRLAHEELDNIPEISGHYDRPSSYREAALRLTVARKSERNLDSMMLVIFSWHDVRIHPTPPVPPDKWMDPSAFEDATPF